MHTLSEYIGVVARTHGLDGTMLLIDTVGIPKSLVPEMKVGIGYSRDFVTMYTIEVYDSTPMRTHLRLHEISSADQAQQLVDQAVYAQPQDVGFHDDDRYRIGDIEGCRIILEDGSDLGVVTDVWLMPANDVWVVTMLDGRTLPLPVIDDVVTKVDLVQRCITVHILPGLMDLASSSTDVDDE